MFSMPPATTASASPALMAWAAIVIAFIPEAQTLLTVMALVSSGSPAIDAGLTARVLPQPRLEDVAHDAFVEIDRCERLGIVVMFLLDLRLIHIPEDIGAAGADGGADLRPEPGPADGFLDDQRTQIDGPYILERSAETADGGPGPAYDDNVSHLTASFLAFSPSCPCYTRISIASPWAAPEQMPQTPRPPPRLLSS